MNAAACLLATLLATLVVAGCGAVDEPPPRSPRSDRSAGPGERVAAPGLAEALAAEAPVVRRKVWRTITLGQTGDVYANDQPAPEPGAAASEEADGVVVIGGGVTGYGYPGEAGYVGDFGFDPGFGVTVDGSRPPPGWEGAQRTARPGETPVVGGNWAPPPSYGPAPMR
jgi:hypothetical protein